MLRYIFLSVFAVLLIVACGDATPDSTVQALLSTPTKFKPIDATSDSKLKPGDATELVVRHLSSIPFSVDVFNNKTTSRSCWSWYADFLNEVPELEISEDYLGSGIWEVVISRDSEPGKAVNVLFPTWQVNERTLLVSQTLHPDFPKLPPGRSTAGTTNVACYEHPF